MAHIVVVGLNFKSAPIALRERLAFPQDSWSSLYPKIQQQVGVQETAVLSTCNRVELYTSTDNMAAAPDRLHDFLIDHSRMTASEVKPALYTYTQPQSVQHLFTVTSGLDSMVVGESEIQYQVKKAYEHAKSEGATGKYLNVLFQKALNAAKSVRTETGIGRICNSVGTVSVDLAQKVFGSLKGKSVLLLGAGEMAQSTLKRLAIRGSDHIAIINRSQERAEHLAQQHGGVYYLWHHLEEKAAQADIIICSTAAQSAILTKKMVQGMMQSRHNRALYIVDLGVPRNVEVSVGELDNVYLFNVDDLQKIADKNDLQQQQAILASQKILHRKVEHYLNWWQAETSRCAPSSWERAEAS